MTAEGLWFDQDGQVTKEPEAAEVSEDAKRITLRGVAWQRDLKWVMFGCFLIMLFLGCFFSVGLVMMDGFCVGFLSFWNATCSVVLLFLGL